MDIKWTDEKVNILLNGLRALNAVAGTTIENSQKIISLHEEMSQSIKRMTKEMPKDES